MQSPSYGILFCKAPHPCIASGFLSRIQITKISEFVIDARRWPGLRYSFFDYLETFFAELFILTV